MQILPERQRERDHLYLVYFWHLFFIFTSFWFVVLLFLAAKINKLWFEATGGVGEGGRALESIARFLFTLYFPVQLKECVCACFSFFLLHFFDVLRLVFSQSQRKLCAEHVRHGTVWHFGTLKKLRAKQKTQQRLDDFNSTSSASRVQLNNNCRKNKTLAKQKQKNCKNWRVKREGRRKKAKPRQTDINQVVPSIL